LILTFATRGAVSMSAFFAAPFDHSVVCFVFLCAIHR